MGGNRACPSSANLLYTGFMASGYYSQNGGGSNFLCMHPSPQWAPGMSNGDQNGALLYGTEYENTGAVDKNHNGDAACSVCEHNNSPSVYVQWGRKTCSNGHRMEYYGLIMANRYSHKGKSEYLCVDWDRAVHGTSTNTDHNGALLYTTEMQTSTHSSGDQAQYGHDREQSCVVCSP